MLSRRLPVRVVNSDKSSGNNTVSIQVLAARTPLCVTTSLVIVRFSGRLSFIFMLSRKGIAYNSWERYSQPIWNLYINISRVISNKEREGKKNCCPPSFIILKGDDMNVVHRWAYIIFCRCMQFLQSFFLAFSHIQAFSYGVLVYPYFSMNAFLFTWQNS